MYIVIKVLDISLFNYFELDGLTKCFALYIILLAILLMLRRLKFIKRYLP